MNSYLETTKVMNTQPLLTNTSNNSSGKKSAYAAVLQDIIEEEYKGPVSEFSAAD